MRLIIYHKSGTRLEVNLLNDIILMQYASGNTRLEADGSNRETRLTEVLEKSEVVKIEIEL